MSQQEGLNLMYRSTTRWTTAAAVAALIALPVAGAAQTTGTTPPQQPPAQTQPQQPPAQPATTAEAQTGQVDATAAKKHLSEARDALSQITSMPEAAKLQGDNRTQVSQLISNFNELITTQANWRDAYAKVDANLTSLVGPEGSEPSPTAVGTSGTTGTAGATGTTGAAATALDPAIRTKLVEFRSHLKLFEKAAGGGQPESSTTAPAAAATASTPDPATTSQPPSSPSQPPSSAGAVGTSGVTPSPTGTMAPMDQAKAADQVAKAEADKHLDAIDEIITKSKNGSLTKDETTELKKHVELLRALLKRPQ